MKNNIATRQFKIIPIAPDGSINKEAYRFISNSMYAQYQALNRASSFMTMLFYKYNQNLSDPGYKEELNAFKYNKTNPRFADISFGIGVDTLSLVSKKIKADFNTAIKNGLARGERSVNNYKRTTPLLTRNRNLRIYYVEKDVYIKWVNGIVFKVVIGRKDRNYRELQCTLRNIIDDLYKVRGSQLFYNKEKELIISLTIDMGENTVLKKSNGKTMGIDLGINIPAFVSIAEQPYIRKAFGDREEFVEHREQFRARCDKLKKRLSLAKGGKGRKDKLSKLESIKEKERAWVKNYNEQLSRKIVDFAIKYNVSTIKMEALTKDGFSDRLLGVWSYYELRQKIMYKASKVGITVELVDPAFTSQTCSKCGHVHEDNRKSQDTFSCQQCGFTTNADWNASVNIGNKEPIVEDKKKIA